MFLSSSHLRRRVCVPACKEALLSCGSRSMSSKQHEAFSVTIENKVAHIQMNRPAALNTMNRAFWNELPQIIGEVSYLISDAHSWIFIYIHHIESTA